MNVWTKRGERRERGQRGRGGGRERRERERKGMLFIDKVSFNEVDYLVEAM